MRIKLLLLASLLGSCSSNVLGGDSIPKTPKVMVLTVNGAEWDIIKPLLLRGEMPNLAKVIDHGVSGKLRTTSAPVCPKVYSAIFTSTPTSENGISGFKIGGKVTRSEMLKGMPFWKLLSDRGVSVGMANVPATFPVTPVHGYMISGMLTQGVNCDGVLCAPKLSEVRNGDAVYPKSMIPELEAKVGDFHIDCSAMPTAEVLKGKEKEVIDRWLARVSQIRAEQTKLFDYLLTNHPTDFTMFTQSCEDRVGHWLYPIQRYNVGYEPKLHEVAVDAFPDQYREFDKIVGMVLSHLDDQTTLFILSDHGIKPLRDYDPDPHHDHGDGTPIIAHHDFEDGDDVPGVFIAMGPNIHKGEHLLGFRISVLDIAPTILKIYGFDVPPEMKGRVLSEIFN
jgi:predicted AlkP superfamily phosphohydrolase/phosphomutase